MKKAIYIIDISSFFFRSYYAVPSHMTNKKGLPTNALYGTLAMLFKLVDSYKPSHVVCCLDTKYPSFRKNLYPDYKANRGEMPEDLEKQVPYLKKLLKALQIPSFEKKGWEADDLIGGFATLASQASLPCYIVSGDKDFAQLVSQNTKLLDTMKSKTYDPKGVELKWGVPPEKICDYLALIGDSSDNIPGVKGIGPKGALDLLSSYSSVEEIYSNLDKIKTTLQKKLEGQKDICFLSKKLVTISTKDFFKTKMKDLEYRSPDKDELKKILEYLDFKTQLANLYPDNKKTNQKSKAKPKKSSYIKTAWQAQDISLNIEPYSSVWIWENESKFYLGYNKIQAEIPINVEVGKILDSKWLRWKGYDLKYFWNKLCIQHPIAEWDAMVAGHLIDSKVSNDNLSLYKKYLDEDVDTENDPFSLYSAHIRVERLFKERLEKSKLLQVYTDIELPLIAVLHNMESAGILVDKKELSNQSEAAKKELKELQSSIFKESKKEFNISSPKQLSEILFDDLKLPKGKKTKSGYSTDIRELNKIRGKHKVISHIIRYRELFKLQTTYLQAFKKIIHPETQRIHTCFKQTQTSTGRLSSINPNMQNIPMKSEQGREMRKAFIAPQGSLIISADYSQVELRILAHLCKDKALCQAFKEDLDVHTMTACEVFDVKYQDVTSQMRQKSKAVNFGIIYGQGAYGLADTLNISRSEAQEIIQNYFKKFKSIQEYIETEKENLYKRKYVKTLYGRKRFFSSWELNQPALKAQAERAAINAPIQGTASDIVKKAMIELDASSPARLICQVHDELIFECQKSYVDNEIKDIKKIMEEAGKLRVPLKVNIFSGKNWKEAHAN